MGRLPLIRSSLCKGTGRRGSLRSSLYCGRKNFHTGTDDRRGAAQMLDSGKWKNPFDQNGSPRLRGRAITGRQRISGLAGCGGHGHPSCGVYADTDKKAGRHNGSGLRVRTVHFRKNGILQCGNFLSKKIFITQETRFGILSASNPFTASTKRHGVILGKSMLCRHDGL